jgi:hypothetical protein
LRLPQRFRLRMEIFCQGSRHSPIRLKFDMPSKLSADRLISCPLPIPSAIVRTMSGWRPARR